MIVALMTMKMGKSMMKLEGQVNSMLFEFGERIEAAQGVADVVVGAPDELAVTIVVVVICPALRAVDVAAFKWEPGILSLDPAELRKAEKCMSERIQAMKI